MWAMLGLYLGISVVSYLLLIENAPLWEDGPEVAPPQRQTLCAQGVTLPPAQG